MYSKLVPAAIALATLAVPARAQTPTTDTVPVIVAQGTGVIKRAPDQGWVSIAAESRAATPAEAQRQAAEAMTSAQKALAGTGLAQDAIKTTGYTLRPDIEYTSGRSRVRGYIARNEIEVRVDDLSKIGAVIDAAGSSGATQMSGLRFDLKDRAAVEQEVLRLAVQDAMARARAMAAGANASLGPIVRIEESGGRMPPPMPYMMRTAAEAAPAPTPVTPGELEIRAEVSLTVRVRQP
jgi:uncharacterized protein YggE